MKEENRMTRDEMQRFLDQASREGVSEFDAYKKLVEIIGIVYHPAVGKKEDGQKQ